MTTLTCLALLNPHERDSLIHFEEASHKYTILCDPDTKYTSVTTFVHEQFEEFNADIIIGKMMDSPYWSKNKYYGKTPFEIKALWEENRDCAASAGTKMHYDIECYYNKIEVVNDCIEFKYFKNFVEKYPELEAYRTEWVVFDSELKIAGSIDMVFYNKKTREYNIYDWKRSKGIKKSNTFNKYSSNPILSSVPDTNFWHYTLQLNLYKALLQKNYGINITTCALVCLHPENNNNNFQIHKVPDIQSIIMKLFECRKEKLRE